MENFKLSDIKSQIVLVDNVVQKIEYAKRDNLLYVSYIDSNIKPWPVYVSVDERPDLTMFESSKIHNTISFDVPDHIKEIYDIIPKDGHLISDWIKKVEPVVNKVWYLFTKEEKKNIIFLSPGQYSVLYHITKDEDIYQHTIEDVSSIDQHPFCYKCNTLEFTNLYIDVDIHKEQDCLEMCTCCMQCFCRWSCVCGVYRKSDQCIQS